MAGDVPVWPDNMALMTVKGGCLHCLKISAPEAKKISLDKAAEPVSDTFGDRQSLRILYFTGGPCESGHARNQGKMTVRFSFGIGCKGSMKNFL